MREFNDDPIKFIFCKGPPASLGDRSGICPLRLGTEAGSARFAYSPVRFGVLLLGLPVQAPLELCVVVLRAQAVDPPRFQGKGQLGVVRLVLRELI